MNNKSEVSGFSSSLSPNQIETLQNQIRQFKNLGKRFSDSHLPKTIESLNQIATIPIAKPTVTEVDPPAPSLSWQCFNALLHYGPPKAPQDTTVSFAPSDIGCFSKGASLPLVVTLPFVSSLREKMINETTTTSAIDATETNGNHIQYRTDLALLRLQRESRAQLANHHVDVVKAAQFASYSSGVASIHPPVPHAPGNYLSELLPFRAHYRTKKQSKRDVKAAEKEEKRRRAEQDERKKRKVVEHLKAVMTHRDNFFKFHKFRKAECGKTARLMKMWVDNIDAKKEKDEARAEVRRLQALKENDMEAYAALVQDTRNGRLKFLLNETDTYIATINKMIQDQRVEDTVAGDAAESSAVEEISSESVQSGTILAPHTVKSPRSSSAGNATNPVNAIESEMARDSSKSGSGAANKMTQATKDYYRSTHRAVEEVSQPTMLRGGDLKEYQISGLQWMVSLYNNNLNGILADEMGLGKTIQTISLLAYLMEFKHNNGPFLVVVPLSTLSNWVNEFNKWCPDMLKIVYKGAPEERKRLFKEDVEAGQFNVLLTTYEYIMKDKGSLRKLSWQYIIVDEGHRMKNAQSKFAQTLGTVYQSRHRILLTGTPLQNNLPELWALLNFLLPTIFSSVDTFDQWFNKPFTAFRTQGPQAADDATNEVAVLSQEERMLIVHRLHEVLRPFMLRRVKDQVLDQLPEKVEKVLRCNLSGWQRKMYHSITMKGLGSKDKDGASAGGLNNTIMQLRKVCNHPYLFLRDYAVDEDLVRSSGKFELLDRMLPKLKAAGHRVLLFSQMVELMNFLEQFFIMRGFQYLRLDGNTTSEEREKRMFMFNDPDSPYFIFLLSTRAGGLGLNLATADTVIIFDSDWNPMMDAQAQDRAHRIGQKNEVRVFRLLTTSPIEERILSRANDKKNLTGLVVEAGKFNSKATGASAYNENKELMESMLNEWSTGGGRAFSSDGPSGAADYEGEEDDLPDDEQINEMMASYAGEMELYQAMDAERYRAKAAHWAAIHQVSEVSKAPPLPTRLMGAVERPPWVTNDCWPTKYSVLMQDMMTDTPSGPKKKGRKKKSESMAHDVYSMENSGDLERESMMAVEGESGSEEEEEGSVANTEDHMVAGKVMRKRKDVQYDDGLTDLQYTRYLEKQHDAVERGVPLSPPPISKKNMPLTQLEDGDTAAVGCGPIHKALLKVLKEVQKVKRTDGLSFVCDLFVEKPPKAIYPDYYALIQSPISLKEVTAKLRKGTYRFLEEVELDLALMSHNARTFNMDTSPVFSDCETVRREFFERSLSVRDKFNLPAPPSSTMIPLPAIGHHIYDSPRAYRCPLAHAGKDDAGGYDSDSVVVAVKGKKNTPGKRKIVVSADSQGPQSSKKRAKLESSSASNDRVASFHDQYPQESIRFPPVAFAKDGHAAGNSSSSLSLSIKRNPPAAAPKTEARQTERPSLVLSFNRKALQSQADQLSSEEEGEVDEEEEQEEYDE